MSKISGGLGTQVQDRSMELYGQIGKTYIDDEYDYWGTNGDMKLSKNKVNNAGF